MSDAPQEPQSQSTEAELIAVRREKLAKLRELGVDPRAVEFDMDGVKASMGLDPSVNRLTYRELQARRELTQRRMREHVGR